ncbi:MAG: alpha/beta hydrolase family protein [Jatrophihabitans sp.]|uniref:alpha/beta hydrolase family protein n=1 Tax=Jatrophihabitans sp. TaxID=1932789 RepID=UPI003F8186B0
MRTMRWGVALLGIAAAVVVPSATGAGASTGTYAPDYARAVVAAATPFGGAPAPGVDGIDRECFAPATRIDPMAVLGVATNPAWIARDALNQYCATLRLRDQAVSPAFTSALVQQGTDLYLQQTLQQLADLPSHLHGGLTTLVPGALAADPFRTLTSWQQLTGGRVQPVVFTATDGAQLRGHLFLPPASLPRPAAGYPGVVITDGSVQAYENLYYWAAEGLAQYGYEVLTYDVQGQGSSDLLPSPCLPTSCPGVPYQQNYNFYQGAEDSLSFFLSDANPGRAVLDAQRVGIAGHSLGAGAVSWVGQCDTRVRTIVAWDDLQPVDPSQCAANVTVPAPYRATTLHTPALAMTNDYEFNVQPQLSTPNPHGGTNSGGGAGDKGYQSLAAAGVDSELISLRNGTHLTYSYIDYVLSSNQLSERFAFYWTLAWLDQYLRGGSDPLTPQPAFTRLTSSAAYDDSADVNASGPVSIGAGTYDPARGNVPYRIAGIPIPGSLSFYFYSQYRLTDPATGSVRTCGDLLAGCPAVTPPTP